MVEFSSDLYTVQNVPNNTDFLYVGRYKNKCHILVSRNKVPEDMFYFYESNVGKNVPVEKIKFSDFYSVIRLVDKAEMEKKNA